MRARGYDGFMLREPVDADIEKAADYETKEKVKQQI
jgi:hypothetical protein